MPIEFTTAALTKILSPLVGAIAKDLVALLKNQARNFNASTSVEKLAKTVININTVKTMWSRDKGIPIDSFYYPSKIAKGKREFNKKTITVNSINDLPSENLIIEGVVGQGKSIFLRHLCNSAIDCNLIPVFIELRMISEKRSLTDLINSFLDSAGLYGGDEIFPYLADSGKIILILDGFDEIQSTNVSDTIYEIEKIQSKYTNLRIITSSRPHNAIQSVSGFIVLELSQLESEDYDPFLRKLIHDPVKRFDITQAINDSPKNIKGVVNTPLMLTLLVSVYETEKEIPSTLPDFFDKLFNIVFSKHDKLKAGFNRQHHSGLSETKLQKLFDAFCFMLAQADVGRSVTKHEFKEAFNKALKYTPSAQCELENFSKDIVKVACLMLEDGIDHITFLHKSILEYHAASFIKNSSDEIAKKFYNKAPDNYETWQSVLLFLSNIDTFRYARDYILVEFPPAIEKLRGTLSKKDTNSLGDYINSIQPKLRIGIEGTRFRSWAASTSPRHSFGQAIETELLTLSITQIGHGDNLRKVKKAIQETDQKIGPHREKLQYISMQSFIRNFDQTSIWKLLNNTEIEMTKILNEHQLIVESELGKTDIFD